MAALLSDQGGNLFLGLNLVLLSVIYLLLVSLSWNCSGPCKQTVIIEISTQCNFYFFFSFFFFSKKTESHGRDSDSMQGKKQIVWDLGG